ncbi:MAG: quinolinate synthase NadA [Anaerolineales bacterium]|nr:quinolinate synthase NadA [Anaerolineales bacterium]
MMNTPESLMAAAKKLIELAISEDIGPGDATSLSTLDQNSILYGYLIAKEDGVIAGLPIAEAVFHRVDPSIQFEARVKDGQEVVAGELMAIVTGPGRSLLAAERTALNFLQRLSGIATLTRNYVEAVACTGATILDTRKTIPGYRELDKYAVRMGGGVNHRMSLFDMMMIKDNHVDGAGGVTPAVERARTAYPNLPIEIEVRNLDELKKALRTQPPLDRILLDNMDLETLRKAVEITKNQVPLEASGGVKLDTVAGIAATGVDYISSGEITHSVKALDLSMKIRRPEYQKTPGELDARIQEIKDAFGKRLIVLAHHYQRDEVIKHADYRGDSLKMARDAADSDAEFIVVCGVHFMGEVAAILAGPNQHVLSPKPSAGCYLADTATLKEVEIAWALLDNAVGSVEEKITPITYVNSSAELKTFCGKHGGIVCTSGNAEQVLDWALNQRTQVFFFPDQHLGWNTAKKMGIPQDKVLGWNREHPPSAEQIRQASVILWPGACNVHQNFRPEHIGAVRRQYPAIKVMAHPECKTRVVDLADYSGSTAGIIRQIENAPAGSQWAIATENHLVSRLQQNHPDQLIISLADVPPYCRTMGQITLRNLYQVLESLSHNEFTNEITINDQVKYWSSMALDRMLEL